MLTSVRYHSRKKVPVLLLVFLLCVQSLGFASHGLRAKADLKASVSEQSMPPCHDMQMADTEHQHLTATAQPMPCCEEGQCADAHCMMPAGVYFPELAQNYFLGHDSDQPIADDPGVFSITPSPPIRPPIA